MRALLVDIVRRCQSAVADNFRVIKTPRADVSNLLHPSPFQSADTELPRGDGIFANTQLLVPTVESPPSVFFQEPPHVGIETTLPLPTSSQGLTTQDKPWSQPTDSGYESSQQMCYCSCHLNSGHDQTLRGMYATRSFWHNTLMTHDRPTILCRSYPPTPSSVGSKLLRFGEFI